MPTINPYINFGGQAREALAFYQTIFGGQTDILSAKDSAIADQLPPEGQDMVFHASLHGGALHLMASDMAQSPELGTAISMAIMCDSEEQLREYFDKLKKTVVYPVEKSEWGGIYGQVVDQFGVSWMLNFQEQS